MKFNVCGAEGVRTPDPHTASVVRYQLRYSPRASAYRPSRRWKHYSTPDGG